MCTGNRQIENTTDLTALLQKWLTTGIRLTFKENPYKEYYEVRKTKRWTFYNRLLTDYLIYLNQDDIKPLIPLLETLIDLYLTDDIIAQIKELVPSMEDPKAMFTNLKTGINNGETFEIGLCFNKN